MNYTPEQTEYMVAKYLENPNRETVELLAEKMEEHSKNGENLNYIKFTNIIF